MGSRSVIAIAVGLGVLLVLALAFAGYQWFQLNQAEERNTATIAMASQNAGEQLDAVDSYLARAQAQEQTALSLERSVTGLNAAAEEIEYLATVDRAHTESWQTIHRKLADMVVKLNEFQVTVDRTGELGETDLLVIQDIHDSVALLERALPVVQDYEQYGSAEVTFDEEAIQAVVDAIEQITSF